MPYDYQVQKGYIFTDEGQRMFLRIRDKCKSLLVQAGAFRIEEAMRGNTGSSWDMLACFDRLVELGEIKELKHDCMGQHRVFIES